MQESREILQTIARGTLATTSAAEAVKKAVEDKKSSTTGWSKLIATPAKPNIFDYKPQEEEIKAFREWSWVFGKYLSTVDEGYKHIWQLLGQHVHFSAFHNKKMELLNAKSLVSEAKAQETRDA